MRKLTAESAVKLQRILSKRFGRELTRQELEEAYNNLMDFAVALMDLSTNGQEENTTCKDNKDHIKL